MTKREFTDLAVKVVGVLALVLVAFGVLTDTPAPPEDNQPTARGVSNFDDVTASGTITGADLAATDDVTITDDLDVGGEANFGASNMYPLLIDDSSEGLYVASTTITGTLAITESTHSLSALTAAFCTLGATPGTGAGDAALCWVGLSGTTATITVEQDDWTTNATNGVVIHYAIVGTP